MEYPAQEGPAAKAGVRWHCRPVNLQFVSQTRHSNCEFVIIDTGRVGSCLQTLLARNYS